jgi:hypothetical protein
MQVNNTSQFFVMDIAMDCANLQPRSKASVTDSLNSNLHSETAAVILEDMLDSIMAILSLSSLISEVCSLIVDFADRSEEEQSLEPPVKQQLKLSCLFEIQFRCQGRVCWVAMGAPTWG